MGDGWAVLGSMHSNGGLMNWKRRMRRDLLSGLLGGAAATGVYWGLLHTTLHGFAAGMLLPAAFFVVRHDPHCAPLRCGLEELAANTVLYAFWITIVLVGIDLLLLLKRKLAH
jgi:hypothetical protein